MKPDDEAPWRVELRIRRGPPIRVRSARVDVQGPGTSFGGLEQWKAGWPLVPGEVLDQSVWTRKKREALDLAASEGYLSAEFIEHSMKLDLIGNQADLVLVLDTGPQARFGTIEMRQDEVDPAVLANLPRFKPGSDIVPISSTSCGSISGKPGISRTST